MQTLLLSLGEWDLVVDARGNIAAATEPYSLAQDAASVIKTFLGECYWDTSLGLPYLTQIFGRRIPVSLLKQFMIDAALTVPDVVSAQVFLTSLNNRLLRGQVQVVSTTGQTSTATVFVPLNPQGTG